MLTSAFKEGQAGHRIELDCVLDYGLMYNLIRSWYSDTLCIQRENVLQYLIFAHMYQIEDLTQITEDFIKRGLNSLNADILLRTCGLHFSEELVKACENVVS